MLKLIKTWHHNLNKTDVLSSQYSIDDNGVLNGECRTWNPDGNLETQCSYTDGKIVGKKVFFGLNGKVDKEIDYDFDGCPFVVRLYADELTEEWMRAVGLASGLEGLTLMKILDAFDHVRSEKEALERELAKYKEIDKRPQNASSQPFVYTQDRETKVTFT